MVNHVDYEGNTRMNLAALLSEDEGKTWKYRLLLDERREVSYPDAVEGEEEKEVQRKNPWRKFIVAHVKYSMPKSQKRISSQENW